MVMVSRELSGDFSFCILFKLVIKHSKRKLQNQHCYAAFALILGPGSGWIYDFLAVPCGSLVDFFYTICDERRIM